MKRSIRLRREPSRKQASNSKRTKKPIKKIGNAVMEIVGLISLAFIAWVLFQGGDLQTSESRDSKKPIERTFSESIAAAKTWNLQR